LGKKTQPAYGAKREMPDSSQPLGQGSRDTTLAQHIGGGSSKRGIKIEKRLTILPVARDATIGSKFNVQRGEGTWGRFTGIRRGGRWGTARVHRHTQRAFLKGGKG